jgi:hypothetical protein
MRVTPRSLSRATWLPTLAAALVGAAALAPTAVEAGYVQTNLVANDLAYLDPALVASGPPQFLEPALRNAWAVSLRPAGPLAR